MQDPLPFLTGNLGPLGKGVCRRLAGGVHVLCGAANDLAKARIPRGFYVFKTFATIGWLPFTGDEMTYWGRL